MKIHPIWFVCLLTRIAVAYAVKYAVNFKNKSWVTGLLMLAGVGFVYKGVFGSNDEKQIAKVFWHETRFVHGLLYILASVYLLLDNSSLSATLIWTDVLFSTVYRMTMDK